MRLREPVPVAEALGLLRPLLLSHEVTSTLPHFFSSLEPPETSGPSSLTFVGARVPLRVRAGLSAALVLAEPGVEIGGDAAPGGLPAAPVLRVRSVHEALAALIAALADRFERPAPFGPGAGNRLAPTAVVEGVLEGGVTVEAGAYVARGAYVGAGSRIEANAVLREHCVVGRDCVVQSGAVIGCAGFGFFESKGEGLRAMPHLAGVEIGDDCFIGANSVIAAGVLRPTSLGRGCKLDSHVQIAHNVILGDGALLASQSGIAGSTTVGKRFRMGGAASVDGHLHLGDDVSVAACSAVTKDLPAGAVVAGFPARPIREWRREQALLRRLRESAEGLADGADAEGGKGGEA